MRKALLIVLAFGAAVSSNAVLLYNNSIETASRYNPLNAAQITFDDVNVLAANNPGNMPIRVTSVTVGIRQVAGAPASGIDLFYANINNDATVDGVTQFGSTSVGAVGASVTTLVTVTNPLGLFTVYPSTTFSGGTHSSFAIGVKILNASSNLNGWRLTSGPDANADLFNAWTSPARPSGQGVFFFGGNPRATFYIKLEGTPVPEPASMAAIGLGLAGLVARRRRNKK